MSDRIFTPARNFSGLFFANCGSLNRTMGCILQKPISGSFSLYDAFSIDDSCFFFTKDPIKSGDEKFFGSSLQKYVLHNAGTRFIWVLNPQNLSLGKDLGPYLKLASFDPKKNPTHITIQNTAVFEFESVHFVISGGCRVLFPSHTDKSIQIDQLAGSNKSIFLATNYGKNKQYVTPLSVSLPFCDSYAGTFQTTARLKSGTGVSDLERFDMGFRIFYPTPTSLNAGILVQDEDASAPAVAVSSIRYPFLNEQTSRTQVMYPTLDPLNIMNPDRTFFSFSDQRQANPPAPKAIPTNYRTNLGKKINLVPHESARFIFAQNVRKSPVPKKTPLYLIPIGQYDLPTQPGTANASSQADNFMCGLSGVEYIQLASGSNTLEFVQNNNGYAPDFNPSDSNGASGSGTRLTGLATTSWAYIKSNTKGLSLNYFAQPDKASLFGSNGASTDRNGSADPTVSYQALDFMPVIASKLPQTLRGSGSNPKLLVPIFPYAGVQGNSEELAVFQEMEVEVVSPERRSLIYEIQKAQPQAREVLPKPEAAVTKMGTTPQGILGTFSYPSTDPNEMATDVTLLLAENEIGSTVNLVEVGNPSDLWTSLQTNQLFLVISDPMAIQDYLKPNTSTFVIENWNFELETKWWRSMSGENPTMLIFKFIGKSFQELAGNTDAWSLPNDFNNNNPAKASAALQQYVENTIEQCNFAGPSTPPECSAGNPCQNNDFANIVCNVLMDESWNGILAINCHVPLDQLPPQLEGLTAGIDSSKFYAHHIGVNITPVNLAAGASSTNGVGSLETKPSSLFGLIYYDDPKELPIDSGQYEFKVNTLQVLFENSKIAAFASKIELQINQLFLEESFLGDPDKPNNVWFNGVYQDHDGKPTYTFRTTEPYLFIMNSGVLAEVNLAQGHFVTEIKESQNSFQNNGPHAPIIKSRFAFAGYVNFKALKDFDVFSFEQLSFSNLTIEMLYNPGGLPERTFTFSAGDLALDLAQSDPRKTSLYKHFPLELKSFIQAETGTTPVDLGYMSVTSPLQQGTPTFPWYALEFTLGLGSLGGLAEQADFVARMIAAWSPTYGSGYTVFTGLKIPGLSGDKKEFTIEGPLKLKIQNIQFYAGEVECDNQTKAINYVLRLQAIKLSFFSVSMPPSGRTDFLLFGDPCSSEKTDMLGWYGVYDKGAEKSKSGDQKSIEALIPQLQSTSDERDD